MMSELDQANLPYGDNDKPGAAPAKTSVAPVTPPQPVAAAPAASSELDKANLPYKPGETPGGYSGVPPSTPLDQPIPAFWNRPAGQSIGGYAADVLAHVTQGSTQSAEDKARIIGDTWSYGLGDLALGATGATGADMAAERQKTAEAWKREGIMAPFDASVGYILPGPGDIAAGVRLIKSAPNVAGYVASKATPYAEQATQYVAGRAIPAVSDAVARAIGYASSGGLISGLQDIGHGVYDPRTVAGDVALGSTIAGTGSTVADAAAAGAQKLRDWWRGAPSFTPAEISAASPTNPHAQQFETWSENAARGNPPTTAEVGAYPTRHFGENMANWPSPIVNIYDSTLPREISPGARLALQGVAGLGQAGLLYSGLVDNPAIHTGIQAGAAGVGELINQARKAAGPARVAQAIDNAYPQMTGMYSSGPTVDAANWRDAFHKLVLGQAQPPLLANGAVIQ
jgi:hypothetical protein